MCEIRAAGGIDIENWMSTETVCLYVHIYVYTYIPTCIKADHSNWRGEKIARSSEFKFLQCFIKLSNNHIEFTNYTSEMCRTTTKVTS